MGKIRVGFVGVGSMGQCAHLRNYIRVPDCEIAAIAEIRRDLGRRVAARYDIPKVYTDFREMLSRERLDGIVASQPFNRHGILLPEILRARLPVFIEKPLAASVETGRRIVEAAESAGTWIMVGYRKRSDPAVMYAKEEIVRLRAAGELGKLRHVRILMPAGDYVAGGFCDLVRTDERLPELAVDPPAADMNERDYDAYVGFVNYYIHQINLLRHLLGEPYRVAYADPSGVLLAVESESGIPGAIEMSPYRTTIDWQESAFVAFDHGYVKISLPAPMASHRPGTVEIFRDPGNGRTPETVAPQLPWIHAMRRQAEVFVAALRGEGAPSCTAAEALEDLVVARDYLRLLTGR